MTSKQINRIRERLVTLVDSADTPVEIIPKLVNSCIKFEHGLFELEQKKKAQKTRKEIGLKHE